MPRTISWLHISDLHSCKPRTGWDSRRVLQSLVTDLKHLQADLDLFPDFVFFTGDLAFGHVGTSPGESLADQFCDGAAFLEEVRKAFSPEIPKERVFIVPGNHDINRRSVTSAQTQWLDSLSVIEPVEKMIQSSDLQWTQFMLRLDEYRAFLETSGYAHLLSDPDRLTYSARATLHGVEVGIVGFNSAWSCCRNGEKGKLWVGGRWQAENALESLESADLLIALIHHPGNWLVEYESNAFWRHTLQTRFHFCLHGHEHDAWVESYTSGHNTIAASACYDRSDGPNGYNYVTIQLDNSCAEVWLRRYNQKGGGGWIPEVVPDCTDERGVWPLENLQWLESHGAESRKRNRSKRDGEARKVSDETRVYRASVEARNMVERLVDVARWYTRDEVRRTASKKYIPDLYVRRETETILNRMLTSDEELSAQLSRARTELAEPCFALKNQLNQRLQQLATEHAKAQSEAEAEGEAAEENAGPTKASANSSGKKSKKARKKRSREKSSRTIEAIQDEIADIRARLDHLNELFENIETAWDALLEQNRPCDGDKTVHIDELCQTLESLVRFQRDTEDNVTRTEAEALVSKVLSLLRQHTSNVIVLIDRAGGGKTNLLCHLALARADSEPCLFLHGRIPIEDRRSVVKAIRKRLGENTSVPDSEWIRSLDRSLANSPSHLTVFVDGINECRDLSALNTALLYTCKSFQKTRVRLVLTCRDIYWTFFARRKWTSFAHSKLKGQLYEFTEAEQLVAIEKYLSHYRIKVELGEEALARCRHPLVLRFFCEAYHDHNGDTVELGRVEEIRLKPLFDEYWKNKMQQLHEVSSGAHGPSAEQCLFAIVQHMFTNNATSISSDEFTTITGVDDLDTEDSVYLRLLDEDIVIEEDPAGSISSRRLSFVYEEFMEYAIARQMFEARVLPGKETTTALFENLNGVLAEFVNSLGVGEYICAFCLDAGLYKRALEFVERMTKEGGAWIDIVGNIFSKYDNAAGIFLSLDVSELPQHANTIHLVLAGIGKSSQLALSEACAAIGFWLIFPNVLTLDDVLSQELPPVKTDHRPSVIDVNRAAGMSILKAVGGSLAEAKLNPLRDSLWRRLADTPRSTPVDLREVVRALWNLIASSPRRRMLLSYACNGLFSSSVALRRAAALITREQVGAVGQQLRALALEGETDPDVQELLR